MFQTICFLIYLVGILLIFVYGGVMFAVHTWEAFWSKLF